MFIIAYSTTLTMCKLFYWKLILVHEMLDLHSFYWSVKYYLTTKNCKTDFTKPEKLGNFSKPKNYFNFSGVEILA